MNILTRYKSFLNEQDKQKNCIKLVGQNLGVEHEPFYSLHKKEKMVPSTQNAFFGFYA